MENQELISKLKDEILKELNPVKKPKTKFWWGSFSFTLVLIVFAVVSVAQAFSAAAILQKIKNSSIQSASAAPTGQSQNLPTNVSNLPNMVGGC